MTGWQKSDLCFCANVHAAEDLQQLQQVISGPLSRVRSLRGLPRMGAGLWINQPNLQQLQDAELKANFSRLLQQHAIELYTLNGFPMYNFHQPQVKHLVYQPDWSEPERESYTSQLAQLLADLMPDDISLGSISTLPLGFSTGWTTEKHQQAISHLHQCLIALQQIHRSSGKQIRLCLEMEPGCALQSTGQLIDFFQQDLQTLEPSLIEQYLGICFDICHQAVMFEDIEDSLNSILQAGIQIGKIQVSSALELAEPFNPSALDTLAQFIEPKYLHQSCCLTENGERLQAEDLPQAYNSFPRQSTWRVHFHVPVQATTLLSPLLSTTQQAILQTLQFLQQHPQVNPHLEIETYSWHVLPESLRPESESALSASLAEELSWLEQNMQRYNLLRPVL